MSAAGALEASAATVGSVVLLAVVQGMTEFLPVSSSGHLVLAGAALDLPQQGQLALSVALHLGTLAAVLLVYRADLVALARESVRRRLAPLLPLVVGTLPAAVVGLTLGERFSALVTPRTAGFGLLATALFLCAGEWGRRRQRARGPRPSEEVDREAVRGPSLGVALLIGTFQALAILPGISRSGSTIAAGLVCGLAPADAARFSFLLAIPAIAGAAVLELPGAVQQGAGGLPVGVVAGGVAISGIVGWVALRGLLATLRRGSFLWFALYCAILGSLALAVA